MKHTNKAQLMRGAVSVRADATGNVVDLINNLNASFEEFQAELAAKDKELAKRFDDVVTTEKIDRIQASMNEMQAAVDAANAAADQANATLAGIQLGAGDVRANLTEEQRRYSASFEEYFVNGGGEQEMQAMIKAGEIRAAASVGTDADGGYTAPIEWDRTITDKLKEVSEMREYASVRSVSGQGFSKLFSTGGTDAGWVGETDNRPETNTSTLVPYAFAFGEIYANPAATRHILEDSEIDFAAWMADEVEDAFAEQEGQAFIDGDGVNKPKGILKFTQADETALSAQLRHPLGHIKEINTGIAAAVSFDGLKDLTNDLPKKRSAGAAFYANRQTFGEYQKIKDGNGNYIWQPSAAAGQPATLLGFAAKELSGLPDVAADAIPLMFGNMERTYRIFDRTGINVLRDPYTKKGYILFYTTKRVGGGLWNPEWMRYHKVAA